MPKLIDDRQIYRAVMQAVTQYGYEGATTKRLAAAAGIGEVTLFRRYGNKAQLVQQAMITLSKESDLKGSVRYTGDLHADLLRVVEGYQDSAEKNGLFRYTILIEAARHPELLESLKLLQNRLDSVDRLLAQYQDEGKLKPMDTVQMLAALVGPLIAINLLQLALPVKSQPPLDLETHVTNFVYGYRPSQPV